MHDAVIVSAVRTPVGKAPRGALRYARPDELAATAIAEAMRRVPGADPADVEDVILGCAMPEAEQGLNVARIASLRAGLPVSASAVTVNRFCSSGLQAIAYGAERILLGHAAAVIAGGTESMSLIPMGGHTVSPNPALVDSYPDVYLSTGLVAENHARQSNISREAQDAFALASHERAIAAIDSGRFVEEIVPVTVRAVGAAAGGGAPTTLEVIVDRDEGPRRDTSLQALAKLAPAFHAAGTVTAGNSSQTSDGASALLLVSGQYARDHELVPLARFVAYATAGVPPELFGIGPVPAVQKVLKQAGLTHRRHRPGGTERGVRRPGAGLPRRAGHPARSAERQRRGHRAGPSARVHGGADDDVAGARAGTARRALRPGDDVRRRGYGRGGDIRAVVNSSAQMASLDLVIWRSVDLIW